MKNGERRMRTNTAECFHIMGSWHYPFSVSVSPFPFPLLFPRFLFPCADVHWNFWRMCNSLRLGSEVCNWCRLAISPIWRRRSTNVSKSLQSLFCILHPACVLHSVFILPLVRSLQSAVRSLRFTLTESWIRGKTNDHPVFSNVSNAAVRRPSQNLEN